MIQKETYTRSNINPDIHEAVILYADREPTEEELHYINTHNFDEAYVYAENMGWVVIEQEGGGQVAQNKHSSPNSRMGYANQTQKDKIVERSFSATGAILGGSICILLAIVLLPVILLNDGSVIGALLASMGLSYLGIWFSKQIPKDYQDKIAAEQQRKMEERLRNGYRCPNCGMSAGHPLGAINKGLSIGTLGLASNKVGKTYKCKNCGYMW